MKTKKLLALVLAGAMLFSLNFTAFAASEINDPANGNQAITGDGETTYIETDKFLVVLPTADNWDFILDPQGLVGAYRASQLPGLSASETNLFVDGATDEDLKDFAGKIIAGDYAPTAQNRSSFEVSLGVDVKVTGDVNTVSSAGAVEAGDNTDENIFITAILAKEAVTTNIVSTPVKFATGSDLDGLVAVPLDKSGQTLSFLLENADYVYTGNESQGFSYDKKSDSFGYGTQLSLGGFVNKNANWTAYTLASNANGAKTVGIDAKFSLAKATEDEIGATTNANAYGYIGVAASDPFAVERAAVNGAIADLEENMSDLADAVTAFEGDDNATNKTALEEAVAALETSIAAAEIVLADNENITALSTEIGNLETALALAETAVEEAEELLNPPAVEPALIVGGSEFIFFPSTTTAVTATVRGLDAGVTITGITVGGGLNLANPNHYTTSGNTIIFIPDRVWPTSPVITDDTMLITYSEGSETGKTITIDGLTFGSYLSVGGTKFTTFTNPTTAVTATVVGLADDVTITAINAGGFNLNLSTHATVSGNVITFPGELLWTGNVAITTDVMTITYSPAGGGAAQTVTISGLTFG